MLLKLDTNMELYTAAADGSLHLRIRRVAPYENRWGTPPWMSFPCKIDEGLRLIGGSKLIYADKVKAMTEVLNLKYHN